MITYRDFHNSDPPRLLKLWHACQLGRGAAEGFGSDAFEQTVFAQTYFDPAGLIVACEGDEVVGFVHAGFGANADESALSRETGVICAVMVHPSQRLRGIGRELVRRAEAYLRGACSSTIFAGGARPFNPYYVGVYGGCEPSGFLESDPLAAPFFTSIGYEPEERHVVYQRDITQSAPVSLRLATIRRKMGLVILDQPPNPSWWWITRFGRLETLRFQLAPKEGGPAVAGITAVGLDLYAPKWHARTIGLVDLDVPEEERNKGYGQALVIEVCRRLREELVTRVEAHIPETNMTAIGVLSSAGFQVADAGIVYRKLSS